jgi:hypothetical protein
MSYMFWLTFDCNFKLITVSGKQLVASLCDEFFVTSFCMIGLSFAVNFMGEC